MISKVIAILTFYCASGCIFSQTGNPYLRFKADSIVFYDFGSNSGKEDLSIIEKNGALSHTVKRSARLDQTTGYHFSTLLGEATSYGAGTASCFDPHLGVVYYKDKKAIAYINICMGCNRLYSSKPLKAQEQGRQGEGKDAYYIADGMSKTFRKEINAMLIKYNFSNQLDGNSVFDN